jgi:streptogramin lyase
MKANNFWGKSRSTGVNVGLIVRLGLALAAVAGSLALAWTLLSSHQRAHATSTANEISTTRGTPWGISIDSHGNTWVAEPNCLPDPGFGGACGTNGLAAGAIDEFNLSGGLPSRVKGLTPPSVMNPTFIVADGSGNAWFTDPTHNAIGEVTTGGKWTEYTATTSNANPYDLILDKNGILWFTEINGNKIGAFDTTKLSMVGETLVPTLNSQPLGIAYDATHDVVWFSENGANKVGHFSSATTTITIAEIAVTSASHLITLDSNGNVWYSEPFIIPPLVGEIPGGSGTPVDFNACTANPCGNTFIGGIGADSSGNVWYNDAPSDNVDWLNPTTKATTAIPLPTANGHPQDGLAVDGSNNVWVTEQFANNVAEIPAGTTPPTPTPTTSGTGTPSPTATATNTPSPTPTGTPPPNLPPGPVNTTWYFAEGKVGQGFTEYLTIQNPDPVNTCTVNIQYLLSTSTPAPKSLTVLPNTRWTEGVNNDLNTPASSTSYQAVSTIVTVTNTTICKGVVVERPIYFTNFKGISSGTDALGATKLGTDYYFADVSTLSGYNSYITILNPPNGTAATITVTYYSAGVNQGTDTLVVQPGTRGTIIPKSLNARAATWVHSDQPVVVERPTYFNNYSYGNAQNVYGSATVVGAPQPANDWRFAEGYIGGQFQENLILANFGTTTANATVVLEYDNGSTLTNTYTINSQDNITLDVNFATNHTIGVCSPMPCALSQSVSAEITTSTGTNIVAEREMFFHFNHFDRALNQTTTARGGTDVIGQSGAATATSYSFAEGYTFNGYDEWLTVQNPTANVETVWVTLINGKGTVYSFSISVLAHSRYTVNINEDVVLHMLHPNDGTAGYQVSMTVQTTDASVFVAERPMYWNVNGSQGGDDVLGYIGG